MVSWVVTSIQLFHTFLSNSFDCCTERYEIDVLLPNSELTKGINKRDADARTVCLRRKTMACGLFKLPITSLFVVRNIKCGYSFS